MARPDFNVEWTVGMAHPSVESCRICRQAWQRQSFGDQGMASQATGTGGERTLLVISTTESAILVTEPQGEDVRACSPQG